MIAIWNRADDITRRALIALLAVISVGYLLAIWQGVQDLVNDVENPIYTPLQLSFIVFLYFAYLQLSVRGNAWAEHGPRNLYHSSFWARILIIFLTQIVSPVGFFWLIVLPMVGDVEEQFSTLLRIPLYALMLGLMVLPFFLAGNSLTDLAPTLFTFIPALLFVAAFTRMQLNERDAREKAENLTKDLERANHQLAAYATQAEELATTKERNRLAREIHDNLGHYLTVVNVQLEAARLVIDKNPDKAKDAVHTAQKLTKEGLEAIRTSISSLRDNALANRPISEAIAELVEMNKTSGIVTSYTVTGTERSLEPKTALTLYRVVQEGLTNVRKHSQANHVTLLLDYSADNEVKVTMQDDGVGSDKTETGFGLLGIRERINLLGGQIDIQTAQNKGFKLAVAIPG